jgi:HD-GYP domain-containing protein (c-di-GMP phosphodiesterase class II)
VKTSEIEIGSRFAKPIYNRDGVLLFNSGVKIDANMIARLRELNLYGTYLLDPAEPVPPITDEELEFERFQWTETYVVQEVLLDVINDNVPQKLEGLVDTLYSHFGHMKRKMNFNQCLRGENDFIYKHSLNVAVLVTLLAKRMNFDIKEIRYLIEAALFHDIGKLFVPPEILQKEGTLTPEEMSTIYSSLLKGFQIFNDNYHYPAGMRRYVLQLSRDLTNRLPEYPDYEQTLLLGTKIIQVADLYDTLTAVRSYKQPMSAFSAMKVLRSEPERYDPSVLEALAECIYILPAGSYVMLSNDEQGIVVTENPREIDRPMVLGLMTNTLYDLEMRSVYKEIQIVDTVFTPDNRQHIEIDLSKFMNQAEKK